MKRFLKGSVAVLLIAVLLSAYIPVLAATDKSPTTKAIGFVQVSDATYTGKKLTPKVKVYDIEGNKVSSKYYVVKVTGTPKKVGTYKVTITGKAPYTGKKTAKFVINKANNPYKIVAGKTVINSSVKKDQTVSIKVTGVKGNAKLGPWSSTNPSVYVKNGKIIIKKRFWGTVYLSIRTNATANYKQTRKYIKLTIKKR